MESGETTLEIETHPRRSCREKVIRWSQRALLAVGVGCLGVYAAARVEAGLAQVYYGEQLDRAKAARDGGVPPGEPAAAAPRTGELLGRIDIPDAGVSSVIFEGTGDTILRRGVGHVPGTSLPGQAGNVALAGHRDSVFKGLENVRPGVRVTLETPAAELVYAVESTSVVEPTDVWVLNDREGDTLTLVTCFPFRWVGPAPRRFVVFARRLAP